MSLEAARPKMRATVSRRLAVFGASPRHHRPGRCAGRLSAGL